MNFQQLRIVRETVRQNFNLTEVANALYTSQSGVSKHIKDLEDELGVELFIRRGKRLLGMTEPGRELLKIVERLLLDAQNIRSLADQFSQQDAGELTIATTHTQARYVLPNIVAQFRQRYPRVRLQMHQGSPTEIAQMLLEGRADIGIATETLANVEGVVSYPYHRWHHGVLVPKGHALVSVAPLTLEAIAAEPIITYHEGFTGRATLERTFSEAGLAPDIVLSALDADVIKSYVELGMGVGIVAELAYNPERDQGLVLLDCAHLFPENVTRLAVREGQLLRQYAYEFIGLCSERVLEQIRIFTQGS
ncbi:MAG TPA: CysB family HTH-type transcriptional regulator [Hyphomicrobiales bacterium]|nr:CysB family HTH-type transcriptional regulator [Hyphomicrobiales bacterium]